MQEQELAELKQAQQQVLQARRTPDIDQGITPIKEEDDNDDNDDQNKNISQNRDDDGEGDS